MPKVTLGKKVNLFMFNFNFGKKKPDIKQYAIIGVVLSSVIAILSQCSSIPSNQLWDLLDEIQRKYFPQTILNEFIINDDEKLNRRIGRDVGRAIDDYWTQTEVKPVEVPAPIFSEKHEPMLSRLFECVISKFDFFNCNSVLKLFFILIFYEYPHQK